MRRRDREVEILLHGQEWKYLEIIAGHFDGKEVTAEAVRRLLDDKPQRIRTGLSELVRAGYLDAETMRLTARGREAWEAQSFWKKELSWWMARLGVSEALIDRQADVLMDAMEPEVIQRIHVQNEYLRTLEVNRSSQETFHNSDLVGTLQKGAYKVRSVFLDPEKRQGSSGFCDFSCLGQYFSAQAELLVEPLKSSLTLQWDRRFGTLLEVCYLWEGKRQLRRARENRLSIPIADFTITHVRAYELLEAKLELTVGFRDRDGREQRIPACLLASLPINGRK